MSESLKIYFNAQSDLNPCLKIPKRQNASFPKVGGIAERKNFGGPLEGLGTTGKAMGAPLQSLLKFVVGLRPTVQIKLVNRLRCGTAWNKVLRGRD